MHVCLFSFKVFYIIQINQNLKMENTSFFSCVMKVGILQGVVTTVKPINQQGISVKVSKNASATAASIELCKYKSKSFHLVS